MRVLVIGGAGLVGGLTLPRLRERHEARVFDRRPPADASVDHVVGDVCDFEAVARAARGCDALIYMAMGRYLGVGQPYERNVDALTSSMDANVKGLYLSLHAAISAGVRHAVYTSSMSIYDDRNLLHRYFPDEEIAPDAFDVYGFTKRLGEEVCRNTARERGIGVNALRLCLPMSDEEWHRTVKPGTPTIKTAGSDVANALLAALEYRDAGFNAFMISGDYEHKITNLSKAKRLLGWAPLARPVP